MVEKSASCAHGFKLPADDDDMKLICFLFCLGQLDQNQTFFVLFAFLFDFIFRRCEKWKKRIILGFKSIVSSCDSLFSTTHSSLLGAR
jgi:hypothetical protein